MEHRTLSIDVGIKNLALCLFCKNTNSELVIENWDVINIAQDEIQLCIYPNCNKPAKFMKDTDTFCLKHSKKQSFLIPTAEMKITFIKKQPLAKLYEIADNYKIKYDMPSKKTILISLIESYIKQNSFEPIKKVDATKVDLVKIGKNMAIKLNDFLDKTNVTKINNLIIENQIGPIANKMKTIQGMIVQYFIMKNNIEVKNIEFISAINKLKDLGGNNTENYGERKKLGITKCLEYLTNDNHFNSMKTFFIEHKKKDDLADCFLQGLWFHMVKNKNN
jgi:hypothetical protein